MSRVQHRPADRPDARAHDAEIDALVARHGPTVWRVAVSIVRDHALADDVSQDVMVKAWEALDGFDGGVPVAWLRRVARNTAISALRSRSRLEFTDVLDREEATIPSVERQVEGHALSAAVQDAMDLLDPDARAMLVMQQVDGATYDELAEAFGLTPSAVKAKLFRARHALKRSMTEWED